MTNCPAEFVDLAPCACPSSDASGGGNWDFGRRFTAASVLPVSKVVRFHSTRVHRHTGGAMSSSHLPLRRLALCLDCETCFEIGTSSCPACGGHSWVLLSKFLNQAPLRTLSQFKPLPNNLAEK